MEYFQVLWLFKNEFASCISLFMCLTVHYTCKIFNTFCWRCGCRLVPRHPFELVLLCGFLIRRTISLKLSKWKYRLQKHPISYSTFQYLLIHFHLIIRQFSYLNSLGNVYLFNVTSHSVVWGMDMLLSSWFFSLKAFVAIIVFGHKSAFACLYVAYLHCYRLHYQLQRMICYSYDWIIQDVLFLHQVAILPRQMNLKRLLLEYAFVYASDMQISQW